jgi:predicted esterase
MNSRLSAFILLFCGLTSPICAEEKPVETGFQSEVKVQGPTRLAWDFAATTFGTSREKLPGAYESSRQRYQLYIPRGYNPAKSWPLVLFVSPGDDPLGWRCWQKACEDDNLFFCAPYGAGNNCPLAQRIRIVLDALDDVRRRYHIDPEQTYCSGYADGARIACGLAFSLPEHFAGVVALAGQGPLSSLAYLRHRATDRLSVAIVVGADDPARRDSAEAFGPYLSDLGIRSRSWVVPRLGHALPPSDTVVEAERWLAEDLRRRQDDVRDRPALAAKAREMLTDGVRAAKILEQARADLARPDRLFRAVALLEGIVARYGRTDAADKAQTLLKELRADDRRHRALDEQRKEEDRKLRAATARRLERSGELRGAIRAWDELVQSHAGTEIAKQAPMEIRRLNAVLAATPFLGVQLDGDTTAVRSISPGGPAAKAGMQRGDRLLSLGGTKLTSPSELRDVLKKHKPGDKLDVEVQRGDKTMTLALEVGRSPS